MCRISAAKGAYWLYILLKRVVAPWKDEGGYEFLVLKMILNSADRDASASFSLAASQNGSLLYIPTSWSPASRKWFHSLSRLSSVHAERSRIISVLFVSSPFFHWLKVRVVGFFAMLHLAESVFFLSFLLHRLNSKSHFFGLSYATVKGLMLSWRETCRQGETSALWQLLSSCWTATSRLPSLPSAPHWVASITFWVAGESYLNFDLRSIVTLCFFYKHLE